MRANVWETDNRSVESRGRGRSLLDGFERRWKLGCEMGSDESERVPKRRKRAGMLFFDDPRQGRHDDSNTVDKV
jgi:hypothetical protein